ncbi:MAG: D-lyxose/D-mannose family sugar isomerase [Bacteroidia bacterium]|nr:MAG: D-lyxose/D-mannose family sugar isomerase [Bacteroidia bacterium]
MKRSEINRLIINAISFFESMNFSLPPWAYWSVDTWKERKDHCAEIFDNQLGWDLTDFGLGNFSASGLLLFTLRNGNPKKGLKSYAEKIMVVEENQLTPMHFHWSKMEDIINRGGGNLMIQLYASTDKEELSSQDFELSLDGISRICGPGEVVVLHPGESITLNQGLYHSFYGEPGKGKILVGEVSAVNDDHSDNRFLEKMGRFPEIEEDEAIAYLLSKDYVNVN